MAFTVRLKPGVERTLAAMAKRRQLSRADVVRDALVAYEAAASAGGAGRPYDAWQDVIGVVDLGVRDPIITTGDQFAAVLRPVRARRSR